MQYERPKLIAEASANHNNSLEIAKQLIEEASRAGADLVKFQIYERFSDITSIPTVRYSEQIMKRIEADSEVISRYYLKEEWFPELLHHARKNSIDIIYSCSSLKFIELVREFSSISVLKIASCDATNLRLLARGAELFGELIISTGAISLEEAMHIRDFLRYHCCYSGRICFLYCISRYPCRVDDLYLESIGQMRKLLNCPVGYSDHMPGTNACIASIRYHPCYIEKHLEVKGTDTVDSCVSCDSTSLRGIIESINFRSGIDPRLINGKSDPMLRRSPYTVSVNSHIDINDLEFARPGLGLSIKDTVSLISQGAFTPSQINDAWPQLIQED